MPKYNAWQVVGRHEFQWAEHEILEPSHGGTHPGTSVRDPSVPVVPGHEIVGVIDAVGEGVSRHEVGDRVGVGYLACGSSSTPSDT